MSGTRGFGSAGGVAGDQGIEISRSDLQQEANPSGVMAEDIHEMRERYVLPKLFDPIVFNLVASGGGSVRVVDRSQMVINSVLLQATTGTVNVWFGEFSSISGGAPHLSLTATMGPVQIALPPGGYIFTVQSSGGAAVVTIIPMAV